MESDPRGWEKALVDYDCHWCGFTICCGDDVFWAIAKPYCCTRHADKYRDLDVLSRKRRGPFRDKSDADLRAALRFTRAQEDRLGRPDVHYEDALLEELERRR